MNMAEVADLPEGERLMSAQDNDNDARPHGYERLLTPAEVAEIFRVDTKTVTRWATAGKISYVVTLGGHRRYPESEINELLARGAKRRH